MRHSVLTLLVGLLMSSAPAQETPKKPRPLGPGDHPARSRSVGGSGR